MFIKFIERDYYFFIDCTYITQKLFSFFVSRLTVPLDVVEIPSTFSFWLTYKLCKKVYPSQKRMCYRSAHEPIKHSRQAYFWFKCFELASLLGKNESIDTVRCKENSTPKTATPLLERCCNRAGIHLGISKSDCVTRISAYSVET